MSEKMLFCIGEGKNKKSGIGYQKNNMVFNTQITPEEFDKILIPRIKLPIQKWVSEKDMSDKDKEDNSDYKHLGGYFKKLLYKDAWQEVWSELDDEDKNKFKSIPHFNADIFEQITGIKIDEEVIEITIAEISEALGKKVIIIN
jgi:hypothetical protein